MKIVENLSYLFAEGYLTFIVKELTKILLFFQKIYFIIKDQRLTKSFHNNLELEKHEVFIFHGK